MRYGRSCSCVCCTVLDAANSRVFQQQLLAQQHDADQQNAAPGNLDPNMPLLQLFLQTLMPWNEIDTAAEPAPRGDWEGDDDAEGDER